MKNSGMLKFFIVILVFAVCAYLAYNEVSNNKIRTGIDIRGGVSAVLEPDIPEGSLTADQIASGLESAKVILDKRLESKQIYDGSVVIDPVNRRINVNIPVAAGETNFVP